MPRLLSSSYFPVDRRTQIRNLFPGQAGGIVHGDGPFLFENCVW